MWMNILGILLVIIGIINIFGKDIAWELTSFQNRLEGERSERSGTWEVGSTIGGLIFAGVGLYLLFRV